MRSARETLYSFFQNCTVADLVFWMNPSSSATTEASLGPPRSSDDVHAHICACCVWYPWWRWGNPSPTKTDQRLASPTDNNSTIIKKKRNINVTRFSHRLIIWEEVYKIDSHKPQKRREFILKRILKSWIHTGVIVLFSLSRHLNNECFFIHLI